jgi:tetratricopeptide (TPR) repeat protein
MKSLDPHREVILKKFDEIYFDDLRKARDLIKTLDYKYDHFLLTCIANTYLDEGKHRLAERYIVRAFKIKPTCSDVLWILGIVRWDYGQIDIAIFCFKEIIRIGVKGIIKGGCKKPMHIGLAQINDSKLQLYRLLKERQPAVAKRYLASYKKGLSKGIFTLYKPLEKFL